MEIIGWALVAWSVGVFTGHAIGYIKGRNVDQRARDRQVAMALPEEWCYGHAHKIGDKCENGLTLSMWLDKVTTTR